MGNVLDNKYKTTKQIIHIFTISDVLDKKYSNEYLLG
jgi:hypothetical protein